jgi:signal transduction histidine kinase
MPANPSGGASERASIAERLKAQRDRIVAAWMEAISRDEKIPSSDRLTTAALRDHFPEMLQELIGHLQDAGETGDDSPTRQTGRAHGAGRWRSGYRLDEVLRELARIREIVLAEITTLCGDQVSVTTRDDAILTTRRFFDTIAATSAQQFVRAQDAEVILRSTQLEHAYDQAAAAAGQLRLVEESRLSLIRAVNYELRNALQPVSFAADALLRETDPAQRPEISQQLGAVADRLQTMLDRLTKLSKVLAGEARLELAAVNLDDFLRTLDEAHRARAEEKGLRFECSRSGAIWQVVSDPEKLREIADILLSNAIKFTTTGFVRAEAFAISDQHWVLRVNDSGRGIDPGDAPHIFHEFHTRAEPGNTGLRLGLVLARHLARLLGGEITFQSTVRQGASFELRLPRVPPVV